LFTCLTPTSDSSRSLGKEPKENMGSNVGSEESMRDVDLEGDITIPSRSSRIFSAKGFFACFGDGKEKRESRSNSTDGKISAAVRLSRGSPSKSAPSSSTTKPRELSPPASVSISISESPSPPPRRPSSSSTPPFSPQSDVSKSGAAKSDRNTKKTTVSSKNITYSRLYVCEYDEDYEPVQYLMKIPANAKPGQTVVNVGGLKDCSVVLPDYVYPGETVVLMVNGMRKKRVTSTNSSSSSDTRSTVETVLSNISSRSDEYYAETAKIGSRCPSVQSFDALEALRPVDGV
jgi:hypothetical protein